MIYKKEKVDFSLTGVTHIIAGTYNVNECSEINGDYFSLEGNEII